MSEEGLVKRIYLKSSREQFLKKFFGEEVRFRNRCDCNIGGMNSGKAEKSMLWEMVLAGCHSSLGKFKIVRLWHFLFMKEFSSIQMVDLARFRVKSIVINGWWNVRGSVVSCLSYLVARELA